MTSGNSITFLDSTLSMGIIPQSSPIASVDFRFVNTGTQPIVVLGAKPSCECTSVSYSYEPVLTGDTSHIIVSYDGTGRSPEFFSKSVIVTTSASSNDQVLTFEGELR